MDATLLYVDTAGCDLFESVNGTGSRFNEGEADIVAKHVTHLIQIGMKPQDIAVITPYNGQVEVLRRILLQKYPKLEIRSVDGFQGGEREAVVLSLVRSSDRGMRGIGFLSDQRRLNVAVTRAKRQCTVIGDSDTVSQNSFLKSLVDWIDDHGEYLSAMEYINENSLVRSDHSIIANLESSCPTNSADLSRTPEIGENQVPESLDAEFGNDASPNKANITELKSDLDDRISFFAEIADDGEEMEIESVYVVTIPNYVRSLCTQHSLQCRMNATVAGRQTVTIFKGISTQPEPIVPSSCDFTKEAVKKSEAPGEHVHKDINLEEEAIHIELDLEAKPNATTVVEEKDKMKNDSLPNMNSLLGFLAKERAAREGKSVITTNFDISRKAKTSKGKKKKVKAATAVAPNNVKSASGKLDNSDSDLDEMAFLDAQIQKVQTSHGRKIEASGGTYKSIVNGILLTKPKPQKKKRNTNASDALHSKIKQAQQSRKAKPRKKK